MYVLVIDIQMCVRDASPSIPRPRNHHCSSSDWLLHFHVCMDNTHVIANTHIHTIAHVQRHAHCRTHYPTHIVTLICIFLPYKHTYSCRHPFVTTIAPLHTHTCTDPQVCSVLSLSAPPLAPGLPWVPRRLSPVCCY